METLLRSIINALDTIAVSGRYNRNTLSDCIEALESLVTALGPPAKAPNEEKKEDD